MADRAKKISELDVAASAANTDLLLIVSNAAGNGVTKSINFANIVTSVASRLPGTGSNGQILYTANSINRGSANLTFDGETLTVVSLNVPGHITLGTANSGPNTIHFYGAITSNVVPATPDNYFVGSIDHPWNTVWATNLRSGNLSYTDTGVVLHMQRNTDGYLQSIIQNTSNAANASSNYNISGDVANSTANYGEMGINSSTFSGAGPFSAPTSVYLAAATSNLVVGTYAAYPAIIAVNGGDKTWTYNVDGSSALPGGLVIFTGSATTRAAVNTQVGIAGSNGSVYLSTAGKMYLRVNGTGVATTDWQRVTTTAAD